MKLLSTITLLLATATLFAQAPQTPPKTHLKVGDTAPDFTLPSTAGKPVKLSDFQGKKNVVLAFYPAAFTGGCTNEMKAYGASIAKFEGADTQVFGISTDNTPSQKVFAEQTSATWLIPDSSNSELGLSGLIIGASSGETLAKIAN